MPFIPVANCVQARHQFIHSSGILAENVHYLATTGEPTETDLDEIGDIFGAWALGSWELMSTGDWSALGVQLRAMNEAEGIAVNYTDGYPHQGTVSETPLPLQVSYTVTWNTGLIGRSARGRSYGVGLPPTYVVDQHRLNDAGRASLQVKWNALRSAAETAGHAMQVVSFQEGGVPRTAGRMLPILSTNVRFPIATQRSRLA